MVSIKIDNLKVARVVLIIVRNVIVKIFVTNVRATINYLEGKNVLLIVLMVMLCLTMAKENTVINAILTIVKNVNIMICVKLVKNLLF